MIKHIVCFKLKDNSLENCQKARDILMSMKGRVDTLIDIQVGIDFLHSERSILADEATGNLDIRTSFEVLVLFQELHAAGRTIDLHVGEGRRAGRSDQGAALRARRGTARGNWA